MLPELCTAMNPRQQAESQGTIWGPREHGVKQKYREEFSFADRPQGGHPNGYRRKTG